MTTLALYAPTCEYQTDPIGLGEPRPRLSWKMNSSRRGARQTAYQVRAALTRDALAPGGALLWDSGRIQSDQSVLVEYAGPALHSGERVYWNVRVWDDAGNQAESETSFWEMGLLAAADWQPAQWIGGSLVGGIWTTVPLPYLRRAFQLDGAIARARLYVTALGLYECSFNGSRVGSARFTPGWTDYSKRVQYQVYDVTGMLRGGENVWGAMLGDGWYCGHMMLSGRQAYGDRPKFFAKLRVMFADGREQQVVTDEQWRVHYGALLSSDNYNGESYDARLEQRGWNEAGFDAHAWLPVEIFRDPHIELNASYGTPIRDIQELSPVADPVEFKGFPGSRWVFDFGQNMVGRVRVRVRGQSGTTVRLRFAEVLNPDGTIYTENLRGALQTDTYTLDDSGLQVWEPHFTFHGFRYVELSGLQEPAAREMLTAVVVHSEMPLTGAFECSDPLVNQLQENILWGQRGNFFDVPTDCPQRDERLGWLGDAQVFIRTAAFNMNVAPFFWKWLRDVMDAQTPRGAYPPVAPRARTFTLVDGGPAWAEAGIICPWTIYVTYGDTRILERQYSSMQEFFAYLQATSRDLVRPEPGAQVWSGFGDWLALDMTDSSEEEVGGGREGGTPKRLIGTAFFAHAAQLLLQIARALHRDSDVDKYTAEFERIRAAFQKNFVAADGSLAGNTQTGYVLALYFDLLPDEMRAPALDRLVNLIKERDMHLSTGFVGTPYLNHVLSQGGRSDVAYALLLQRSYPSWLFPVTNGATTIWERWDGWTPERGFQDAGMNSFNHYAYGAIGDWLYSTVAGINSDPAQPGYKHIILRPCFDPSLTYARAAYESVYGKIESEWHRDGDKFEWRIVVPPNTSATVYFPDDSRWVEQNSSDSRTQPISPVLEIESGSYFFRTA